MTANLIGDWPTVARVPYLHELTPFEYFGMKKLEEDGEVERDEGVSAPHWHVRRTS